MYDKEKENLKIKIQKLTNDLNITEKEKESNKEVIQNSLQEVNNLYGQKVDFLQNELLEARTEASTRLVNLTKELNTAKDLLKDQNDTINKLRKKIKEQKYQYGISQKAVNYKLEKSE